MGRRHLTTAVTMLVLVGILVLGIIVGINTLLSPLPGDDQPVADPGASCTTKSLKKGQKIRTRQVQVSVFNGGTRAGLADETMTKLVRRGFKRGDVGNGPSGLTVRRVQVWASEKTSPAARLVARQFGHGTKVHRTKQDLGPGVDVLVGNNLHHLGKAKKALVVRKPSSVCVPNPSASAVAG